MSWKRHWKRPEPQVARVWRGRTSRDNADAYEAYSFAEGIEPLRRLALGVQTFREDGEHETEFVTISYWASVEAMTGFTGANPCVIQPLPRDAEFLLEMSESVQILRLRYSDGLLLRRPSISFERG